MRVKFSKNFRKLYRRAPVKIRQAFNERLEIFLKDTHHPQLYNHSLSGSLRRFRSINITGDWRALFRLIETENEPIAFFDALGTHSQLYGK